MSLNSRMESNKAEEEETTRFRSQTSETDSTLAATSSEASRVQGAGCRVRFQGPGFRVQGAGYGFRVQGSGFRTSEADSGAFAAASSEASMQSLTINDALSESDFSFACLLVLSLELSDKQVYSTL